MAFDVIDGGPDKAEPEELKQLGLPGTEPFTTPIDDGSTNSQAEPDPGGPGPQRELTIEEKIPHMEAALTDLYLRFNLVLGIVSALGEHKGMKLKQRQMPGGGHQFYWQAEGGRIVLPHSGRN